MPVVRKLTKCEAAFIEHLKSVLPKLGNTNGAGRASHSDDEILRLFSESFEDWCKAVRWGQSNTKIKVLASKKG